MALKEELCQIVLQFLQSNWLRFHGTLTLMPFFKHTHSHHFKIRQTLSLNWSKALPWIASTTSGSLQLHDLPRWHCLVHGEPNSSSIVFEFSEEKFLSSQELRVASNFAISGSFQETVLLWQHWERGKVTMRWVFQLINGHQWISPSKHPVK